MRTYIWIGFWFRVPACFYDWAHKSWIGNELGWMTNFDSVLCSGGEGQGKP